jgi:hypothetical protein
MLSERRQFRILYRDFLHRVVDLEILSAGGEAQNLLVQFAALLASFSLVLVIVLSPSYRMSRLPIDRLLVAAWGDEVFLIGTTIAVVGIFTLLAWNALLPERRDSVVLGPLPVRLRTIFLAKSAAVATTLGGAALAVNIFTGFAFPTMVNPGGNDLSGVWRCMFAWWITMAAAGLFTFCALQAMQGLASQLLSYRWFLQFSGMLQLAGFFVILGVYFVMPSFATEAKLAAPEHQRLLAWLPNYWFLGLFQKLAGSANPLFAPLAARALRNLAIAFGIAAVTYVLAWHRNIRRIVEQPDIQPGDRGRASSRLGRFAIFKLFPGSIDRAIILFTARTIARSRQHRLMLAVYGGVGLPLGAAFIRSFLMGATNERWDITNPAFLAVSIVMLVFTVLGTRAVFSLPQALAANWVFQITDVHRPATYFAAARKALYLLAAVPAALAAAIFYLAIWPGRPALEHTVVLGLLSVILIEKSTYQFRKIPFACSYLPGGANLKMRVGVYAMIFLVGVSIGSSLESWALARLERYLLLFVLLLAYGIRCHRRTVEFAESPYNRIQFEDLPDAAVSPLDLRLDGAWSSNDAYVDSIDETFGRTRFQRMKPFFIAAAALCVAGLIYEQAGSALDRHHYPPVGQAWDIGGRKLNLSCAGEGSPTAILESDFAVAGLTWAGIQREIAPFTRACWYDRAGYGASDPGPFPNHSDSVARDLHRLLTAAGVPPPYVLVGNNFSAFHSRVYRGYYPREVAGMVLIDPMNEDTTVLVHNHIESMRPAVRLLIGTLSVLGVWRLLEDSPGPPPQGLSAHEWTQAAAIVHQTKTQMARVGEPPMWISGELARAAGDFGDIPVIVLSPGIRTPKWYTETYDRKLLMHAQLAQRSTRGQQIIVNGRQSLIPYEAPEAVVGAIREVVNAIREVVSASRYKVPDTSSSARPVSEDR